VLYTKTLSIVRKPARSHAPPLAKNKHLILLQKVKGDTPNCSGVFLKLKTRGGLLKEA